MKAEVVILLLLIFVTVKKKTGVMMQIRTYFIGHRDTESAQIKFYVLGYSSGLATFIQYSI
jgi:hypothetical protein